MPAKFRGAEAVKDAYDIALLAKDMDEEIIKESIESLGNKISELSSYILGMRKFRDGIQRKILPLIACGEFPEEIYNKSVEKLKKFT